MITFILCFIQFFYYVFTKEILFVGLDSFEMTLVAVVVGMMELFPEIVLLHRVIERIVEGER